MMRLLYVFALSVLSLLIHARTTDENLQVARYLVERLAMSPESIDNLDLLARREIVVSYPTYESLFETDIPTNCVGSGWTTSEKRTAFEEFVMSIPRLARENGFVGLKSYGDRAISFCSEHNVSNSQALAMAVMEDPGNPCFGTALTLFEKRLVPSDAVTVFVESCMTNASISLIDSDYLASGYAYELMMQSDSLSQDVLANGVAMVLGCPERCLTSRQIDKLLLKLYPTYRISSNRLSRVTASLNYLNAENPFGANTVRLYFDAVTNQLMNAPQPLPEVEALRGL